MTALGPSTGTDAGAPVGAESPVAAGAAAAVGPALRGGLTHDAVRWWVLPAVLVLVAWSCRAAGAGMLPRAGELLAIGALLGFAVLAWMVWRRRFGLRTAWFAAFCAAVAPVTATALTVAPAAVAEGAAVAAALLMVLWRVALAGPPVWVAPLGLLAVSAAWPGAGATLAIAALGPLLVLTRHRRRWAVAGREALLWMAAATCGVLLGQLELLGSATVAPSVVSGRLAALVLLVAAVLLPAGPFALFEYRGSREARLRGDELLQRGLAAVAVGAMVLALVAPRVVTGAVVVTVALAFAVAVAPYVAAYSWDRRPPARWQKVAVLVPAAGLIGVAAATGSWVAPLLALGAVLRPMRQRLDVVFGVFCVAVATLAAPWSSRPAGLWMPAVRSEPAPGWESAELPRGAEETR